jgi:hypothetical protein
LPLVGTQLSSRFSLHWSSIFLRFGLPQGGERVSSSSLKSGCGRPGRTGNSNMRRNWPRGWLRLWIVGAFFWGFYWIWQIYPTTTCHKYGISYRCYTEEGRGQTFVDVDYPYLDILGWLIVPPAAVFVLGLLAPWLVSWIIRGFRSPPPRSAD